MLGFVPLLWPASGSAPAPAEELVACRMLFVTAEAPALALRPRLPAGFVVAPVAPSLSIAPRAPRLAVKPCR